MLLPGPKSYGWFVYAGLHLILNAGSLFLGRAVLGMSFDIPSVGAVFLLSLLAAVVVFLGYFGPRLLSGIFALGNIAAMGYLLFTAFTGKSGGWADLAGFAGYLFLSGLGLALGVTAELLRIFWKSVKRK